MLCIALGIAEAGLVSGWLFRRWRRRAELDVTRLRGARWESAAHLKSVIGLSPESILEWPVWDSDR